MPAIVSAFESLDRAEIRWALLRGDAATGSGAATGGGAGGAGAGAGATGGPAGATRADGDTRSGDVDLLVEAGDVAAAADCLTGLGWVRLPWTEGPGGGFLLFDPAAGAWPWLDVTSSIRVGRHRIGPLAAAAALRRRRRREDGAWVLHPGDEAWVLVIRMLLDPRPPADRHRRRLAAVSEEAATDVGPIVRALAARASPLATEIPRIRLRLAVSDVAGIEGLRDDTAGRVPLPRRLRLRHFVRSLADRITGPLDRRRRGLGIALLGPDGSGKSSTAAALADALPFQVRRVYMGVPPGHESGGIRGLPVPGLAGVLGIAGQWTRWLEGAWHRLRGRTVVFDRYTEEPWLPPRSGDPLVRRLGRRARRAVACPPPDVIVVLDAPGALMFARKGEHDPAHLEAERARYRALAERMDAAVLVDASRPADEVIRAVLEQTWERQRTRLGGPSRTDPRPCGPATQM